MSTSKLSMGLMALLQRQVFLPILKQCIILCFKKINNAFSFVFLTQNGDFSFPWLIFQNQKKMKEFHFPSCLYKMILYFLYTILEHCKWIIVRSPVFLNESGHIKTLKIITRTKDFGIPTIEIFLNKNIFWCTVGMIEKFQVDPT